MGHVPKYLIQKICQRIKQQRLEKARALSLKNDIFFKKKKVAHLFSSEFSLHPDERGKPALWRSWALRERGQSPSGGCLTFAGDTSLSRLPAPVATLSSCMFPSQSPRWNIFLWAPHFSLLNQVQGDKCHRDGWAGLSQGGHPFLEGEKSHLSKQFWVITQRAGPSAHSLCHTQHKTRSDPLMRNDRQISRPRSLTQRGPPPPAPSPWTTDGGPEPAGRGRERARHLWWPQAGPLPTSYSAKTELAFFLRKEAAPVGCRCFNFTSVGWESHSSSPLVSWCPCPSPWWSFPRVFGHRWRGREERGGTQAGSCCPGWSYAPVINSVA